MNEETVDRPGLDALAASCGFAAAHVVQGRSSIADLFKRDRRCGIYLLEFLDGSGYVGQAVEVTRRFVDHASRWEDIARLWFQCVDPEELDATERRIIGELEDKKVLLRNVVHASVVIGERDFDLIMSAEQQAEWLGNPLLVDRTGTRVVDPGLRYRYSRHFEKFKRMPDADDVVSVLREYVSAAVPVPKRSEIAFWNCTCLPSMRSRGATVMTRLNIHAQEVFHARVIPARGLLFNWWLARSPLEERWGLKFQEEVMRRCGSATFSPHTYKPGGHDQINLVAEGRRDALAVLREPSLREAMRRFNLRLMRKGPALNKGNHCLDLADLVVPK